MTAALERPVIYRPFGCAMPLFDIDPHPWNDRPREIVEHPLPKRFPIAPGSRAILLAGTASHGRTDRPSAWQGVFHPRCIPRQESLRAPLDPMTKGLRALGTRPSVATWGPSGETSISLRPMTEALPLRHRSGAAVLLKTMAGATVPLRPTPGSYRAPEPNPSDPPKARHEESGRTPMRGLG